jgi:2-methylcitrate dehydratase PrpD
MTQTASEQREATGTTQQLVDLALHTTVGGLDDEVVRATKHVILDTVACAVGAHETDAGRTVMGWKVRQGGRAESTVVVEGARLPMGAASNVNAQLANVLDADETLHNFAHFASTIVMPALAVGEAVGASGAAVVAAVAVGFDIAARIGVAIPEYGFSPADELVRFPGSGFSWAAIGTAAAAGALLELDSDQMIDALTLAYVTTPSHGCLYSWGAGLGHGPAPWHKYAMYGSIAEAGVDAAVLAHAGFRTGTPFLDRGSEFWRAFGAHGFDWDVIEADVGRRWYIAETSIKPYPFCRYGNPMIDLFTSIMDGNALRASDVDEVVVTIVPYDWLRNLFPAGPPPSLIDSMFSVPHALSMVAGRVPAGPAWCTPEHRADPAAMAFARKVRYEVEPAWRDTLSDQIRETGRFRRMPVRVEVSANGRVHAAEADTAKGDPFADTRLSDDELGDKVHRFCDGALSAGRVDELIAAAASIEQLENVADLTALFGRGAAAT